MSNIPQTFIYEIHETTGSDISLTRVTELPYCFAIEILTSLLITNCQLSYDKVVEQDSDEQLRPDS